MGAQGSPCAQVGMEKSRKTAFSVELTQEEFTKNLIPLPTSPELWAGRSRALSPEAVKLRQCTSGDSGRLATVSGLDIRARLARSASRVN